MSFTIDTTQEQPINLAPQTLYEEVIQNVWFLLSSLEYDIPLNREFGLNAAYIDKPITTATALATADIYDKIGAESRDCKYRFYDRLRKGHIKT